MRLAVLIPTYDNAATILDVLHRALAVWPDVIVVNDGSTDATGRLLQEEQQRTEAFHLVDCTTNGGKGTALRKGFERARQLGYTHVLTLDADGQHYPEDAPALIDLAQRHPNAIIVGSRRFDDANMPPGSRFANRFSNFWFTVQTLRSIPDTQTGFRIYPINRLGGLRILTSRYEAELELLVFSSWRGTPIIPAPVRVFYPDPAERVTHFRPHADFARISVLNTILCLLALLYGWPRILLRRILHHLRRLTSPTSRPTSDL